MSLCKTRKVLFFSKKISNRIFDGAELVSTILDLYLPSSEGVVNRKLGVNSCKTRKILFFL